MHVLLALALLNHHVSGVAKVFSILFAFYIKNSPRRAALLIADRATWTALAPSDHT